jgi:hypothetical protein
MEEGQGTICEDEADDIDRIMSVINILGCQISSISVFVQLLKSVSKRVRPEELLAFCPYDT